MTWGVPSTASTELDAETERLQKKAFAEALMQMPGKPFDAALQVTGTNTNRALWIATNWPNDAEVKAITAQLIEDGGEMQFLPSKADLARKVWELGNTAFEAKDRLAAYRLYGEIRGFIDKPNANVQINNNTNVDNRVLVVKDLGTDDDWEAKAEAQQRALVNVSTSRH